MPDRTQYPVWGMFVATISKREQAGSSCAEIDHGEEKRGKRIETEMRSKPRNAERKSGDRRTRRDVQESEQRDREKRQGREQANSVDDEARRTASASMAARAAVARSTATLPRARSTINDP